LRSLAKNYGNKPVIDAVIGKEQPAAMKDDEINEIRENFMFLLKVDSL